jgi:pimeloyl-ACP methyl ester carboxylesterase
VLASETVSKALWSLAGSLDLLVFWQLWLFAAAFGLILLFLWPWLDSVGAFGPLVTYAEARRMPEFGPDGRVPFFLPSLWGYWVGGNAGIHNLPTRPPWFLAALLWPVLRHFPERFPLLKAVPRGARPVPQIIGAAILLFAIAHVLLFHFYLPNRYTQPTMRVLMILLAGGVLLALIDAMLLWAEEQGARALRDVGWDAVQDAREEGHEALAAAVHERWLAAQARTWTRLEEDLQALARQLGPQRAVGDTASSDEPGVVGIHPNGQPGASSDRECVPPAHPDGTEAIDVLPKLLDAIGFRRGILLGHSDGASIAAIYAGSHQDHRVQGIALIAPHFIVEDISVRSIAEIKEAYETTELRTKLARWHKDVDNAFYGWNGAWLDPAFRDWDISEYLAYIRVPVAILQGADDEYGTMRQVEIAQEECYCPVDVTVIPGAGHQPHREAPEATLDAIQEFANAVLHVHDGSQGRAA